MLAHSSWRARFAGASLVFCSALAAGAITAPDASAQAVSDVVNPIAIDTAAATPLPRDPRVTVGTLPNGIRYYIRRNEKPEKRAELRLVINAGSILEDNDQRG